MSILEEMVFVGLNHMNTAYYEKLGYEIPRSLNKAGKLRIPMGTKISVKINDLQEGSEVLVTRCCDICGKKDTDLKYNAVIRVRKQRDGKDRCYNCTRNVAWNTRKSSITYEMSLDYHAKKDNKDYLLIEYSCKNEKSSSEIFKSTKEIVMWKCVKCKSEYAMSVNDRFNGTNCPYCSGHRTNKTNCLWTTHPEIAKFLENKDLGFNVSQGMGKKIGFKCDMCNFVAKREIRVVVRSGFNCSNCGDNISYPEKVVISLLTQLELEYKTQKRFKWSQNKRYDFYIPSLNMIIETHGKQHYEECFEYKGSRTLEEEQENDRLKEKIAKENGIENYMVIDCRKSELEWIKNNIIISLPMKLIDTDNIDWDVCNTFAQRSLVIEACDLWNNGIKSTVEIGEILNIGRATISRYLKKGKELGWCDYDPIQIQINNGKRTGVTKGKEVVQISLKGEFIKTWISATEAFKVLGINNRSISSACIGKYKSAGGFKWMFESDYKDSLSK